MKALIIMLVMIGIMAVLILRAALTVPMSEYDRLVDDEAPSVIPKEKEIIYGNEHNCIMTLFGECSYSETGCGDCAVVEKVRDALAKNEKPKEG